jgi:hypothetical protein
VKRDYKQETLNLIKRQENLAYRSVNYDDPEWQRQWYLINKRSQETEEKLDLHVVPAWALGYTGKGVVVTVLDDGKQKKFNKSFQKSNSYF